MDGTRNGNRNGTRLDRAWHRARRAISLANYVAATTGAKGGAKKVAVVVDTQSARAKAHRRLLRRVTTRVLRIARKLRERADRDAEDADLSDAHLFRLAPLTDHLALADYAGLLHTCPRLVNVVSVSTRNAPTHARIHTRTYPHMCVSTHAPVPRTAGRSRPRPGLGHESAARPASHCVALHECVLQSQAVRGRAAGV